MVKIIVQNSMSSLNVMYSIVSPPSFQRKVKRFQLPLHRESDRTRLVTPEILYNIFFSLSMTKE